MLKNSLTKFLVKNKYIFLVVVLGSLTWILTMVKSGLVYDYGMGFWGPNGHDGVWHISLANALSQGRFQMPVFGTAVLQNYHIGFDLFIAFIHIITRIPISIIYFQIFPVIASLLIGVLVYVFLKNWKRNGSEIFWSLFFVYFGGNLGWIVTLVKTGELGGESMFWSQQSISTLINPPYALSLIVFLLGLIFLSKNKTKTDIYAAIIFGLLIQIKAYASVIVLGGLFLTGIYKRDIRYLKVWLVSSLISLILFLPFLNDASSLFEFKPFWFLETMMQFPDRVGWTKLGEAMVNYKLAGNFAKGILAYGLAFTVFWYGNLGTRLVEEIYIAKKIIKKQKLDATEIFIASAILIGLTVPMLFVQKGTAWNTIQFFYYTLFFSGILAGITFSGILKSVKSKQFKSLLILGIIIFTVPTTFSTLKHYTPNRPPAKLPIEELEALSFLSEQELGIVLTPLFDKEKANLATENPPRPLYLYESTAYVSAFARQPVFLEDEVNLEITGYNWKLRREDISYFFENPNVGFLEKNNISYIYLVGDIRKEFREFGGLEKIFENSEVNIYEFKNAKI